MGAVCRRAMMLDGKGYSPQCRGVALFDFGYRQLVRPITPFIEDPWTENTRPGGINRDPSPRADFGDRKTQTYGQGAVVFDLHRVFVVRSIAIIKAGYGKA
jgi:hypothetical protein